MSLYNNVIKVFGLDAEFRKVAKERLVTCKKCKFYDKTFGTCGEIYKGGEVTYRKKKYKTCGCIVAAKTKIPTANCPVGKWSSTGGQHEGHLQEAIQVVEIYENAPTKDNLRALYAVYKKIQHPYGHDINPDNISCGSCRAERIKELKVYIKKLSILEL